MGIADIFKNIAAAIRGAVIGVDAANQGGNNGGVPPINARPEIIAGIPNVILLIGGAVAAFFLFKPKKRGRR